LLAIPILKHVYPSPQQDPLTLQNNTPLLPIFLPSINLLARLRDGLQDSLVVEFRRCDDGGGLCVEGDVVGFDAFGLVSLLFLSSFLKQ
jgi:hypothetical protein